jgi:hypothetical protein
MGEYEPDDSRVVTNVPAEAPGEPPRTGPREDEARAMAKPTERQGVADPEPADKPTARDVHGNKQPGYADSSEEDQPADDEEAVPLGK